MTNKINDIKSKLDKTKLQVTALALYLDVNESTVSKWNSNLEQPSLKRLDEVGGILEVDNKTLINSIPRKSTGLANALQVEYKRLLKVGTPKKIKSKNSKGEEIEVNNPEFVMALRIFVKSYRK